MTPAEASELSGRIATAARSVPGVADLHGGMFGEIGTYLPGGRVTGVRVSDRRVEVHVTLYLDYPVRATGDAVRSAVEPLVDLPVYVTVEDLVQRHGDDSRPGGDPSVAGPPVMRRAGAGHLRKENS
ncbi:hypothetical protein EV651_102297 [Kribbella sp. VKM Ac-2571]|uniref:Asp23/Gls24 family envelope stress response protein n=1 Tax=Kribbella sp. VKM Ac-2571 TaxID=2512222 RepID=UPI0010E0C5AC|nr:Asp23/Gls24 family envelope stress response protein [Kribbella sp. VKM Ac-2571]TDO68378.1 hypothetical protein EV651_102297 [Kribbella sp. VKM Ac-2571]